MCDATQNFLIKTSYWVFNRKPLEPQTINNNERFLSKNEELREELKNTLVKIAKENNFEWEDVVRAGKNYLRSVKPKILENPENAKLGIQSAFNMIGNMGEFGYYILGIVGYINRGEKAIKRRETEDDQKKVSIEDKVQEGIDKYFFNVPTSAVKCFGYYSQHHFKFNALGDETSANLLGMIGAITFRDCCGKIVDIEHSENEEEKESRRYLEMIQFVRFFFDNMIDYHNPYYGDNSDSLYYPAKEILSTIVREEDSEIVKIMADQELFGKPDSPLRKKPTYEKLSNAVDKLSDEYKALARSYNFILRDDLHANGHIIKEIMSGRENGEFKLKATPVSGNLLLSYLGIRPSSVRNIGKKITVTRATERLDVSSDKANPLISVSGFSKKTSLFDFAVYNIIKCFELTEPIYESFALVNKKKKDTFVMPDPDKYDMADFLERTKKALIHLQRINSVHEKIRDTSMSDAVFFHIQDTGPKEKQLKLVESSAGLHKEEELDLLERIFAVSAYFWRGNFSEVMGIVNHNVPLRENIVYGTIVGIPEEEILSYGLCYCKEPNRIY